MVQEHDYSRLEPDPEDKGGAKIQNIDEEMEALSDTDKRSKTQRLWRNRSTTKMTSRQRFKTYWRWDSSLAKRARRKSWAA
ncbi:hypothetical protein IscW_ISCW012120 [Ixodes scapularis]|uniref:Uncharacterized protein n=1 Tax=Ixodes scapularis TaxID=6945 RepID=B7QGD1_IXOSC|nr:hypothetical protein IscW_ISCW012120 [Ixodes scapularis]|eukprot:XP_002401502.1 hypothetical protein IscW_ISCW012120 [Ixodes scapularis]